MISRYLPPDLSDEQLDEIVAKAIDDRSAKVRTMAVEICRLAM